MTRNAVRNKKEKEPSVSLAVSTLELHCEINACRPEGTKATNLRLYLPKKI
jgi:hypothetical protein